MAIAAATIAVLLGGQILLDRVCKWLAGTRRIYTSVTSTFREFQLPFTQNYISQVFFGSVDSEHGAYQNVKSSFNML
jgi:hypothetical protein